MVCPKYRRLGYKCAECAKRDRQARRKGFWTETPDGNTIHVNGDPNMDTKTLEALTLMMDLAVKQYSTEQPDVWNPLTSTYEPAS